MSAMINRRTVLAGTAFTGLAALLAACGSNGGSTASSTNKLEAIKSAGKIRVGLEGTYRPFSFHDSNGTLVGPGRNRRVHRNPLGFADCRCGRRPLRHRHQQRLRNRRA